MVISQTPLLCIESKKFILTTLKLSQILFLSSTACPVLRVIEPLFQCLKLPPLSFTPPFSVRAKLYIGSRDAEVLTPIVTQPNNPSAKVSPRYVYSNTGSEVEFAVSVPKTRSSLFVVIVMLFVLYGYVPSTFEIMSWSQKSWPTCEYEPTESVPLAL